MRVRRGELNLVGGFGFNSGKGRKEWLNIYPLASPAYPNRIALLPCDLNVQSYLLNSLPALSAVAF